MLPPSDISLNAKGLNIPEKQMQLLTTMQSLKANSILLQKMQFHSDYIPKSNQAYPTVFHAPNSCVKAKGVSTLISKCLPLQIEDTFADETGHYLFLRAPYGDGRLPLPISTVQMPSRLFFFRNIKQLLTTRDELHV